MPHLPAICDQCGRPAWSRHYIRDNTYHLSDCQDGKCECGGTFKVLDGTYTHLGGPLNFCNAPECDRDKFYQAMEALGGDAYRPLSERAKDGNGNQAPSLSNLGIRFRDLAREVELRRTQARADGPLDERARRLVQLAVALAKAGETETKAQIKAARSAGYSREELDQVSLLASPDGEASLRALKWIEDCLGDERSAQ